MTRLRQSISIRTVKYFLRLANYLFAPKLLGALLLRHGAALVVVATAFRIWLLLAHRVRSLLRVIGGWSFYIEYVQAKDARRRAKNYKEWLIYSAKLDRLEGLERWKQTASKKHEKHKQVLQNMKTLQNLLQEKDLFKLMWFLRKKVTRSLPGSSEDYHVLHTGGTKKIRERSLSLTAEALRAVCRLESPDITAADKLEFFSHLRHTFGRSCLCLSGGATLGLYHVGVVKALFTAGMLPRVISGASVGSIVTAIICTRKKHQLEDLFSNRTEITLEFFKKDGLLDKLRRVASEGAFLDLDSLQKCIRANVPDITFEEAHDLTGMVPNIVVTSRDSHDNSMVCNFLSTPNVLVWSAALCSCALPGMYKPATLYAKNRSGEIVKYDESDVTWIDGSIYMDIPTERLAQLFNVRYRIVSQVNPHVVSFLEGRRAWLPQRILLKSVQYLAREIREIYLGLTALSLLPNHKYITQLIEQGYKGDCTIRPKVGLFEFLKLFRNPTQDQYNQCVAEGQREAWKYIGEIMSHTNIERVLDECVRHLLAQTSHAATKSMESKAKRKIRSSRDKLSSTGTKKVDRASCDRNEAQREIKLAVISGDTGEVKSSQMGPRKLSWSVEEFLRNMYVFSVSFFLIKNACPECR